TFQRWEARIKLSRDAGFWPAFWAFGFHNEIDFLSITQVMTYIPFIHILGIYR
ncbi:MAG: family 16 glycosylhydrolase, partial [Saprospiraceae bacterium]|nr:family 16 glycosylhydrolase [Saprospiraceae bacterium]